MKVIVTGMTSRQANRRSAERAMNFTGLLVKALEIEPNDVDWLEPDLAWDADFVNDYDHVIVGVSSLLSLASNRAYGALNVIGHAWDTGSLALFLDAPDAGKVATSLKVVSANPDALTKKLFSQRKGYEQTFVPAKRRHLDRTIEVLASSDWPTTFVPALPWQTSSSRVFGSAQMLAGGQGITPITLDTFITPLTLPLSAQKRRWTVESMKSDWYRRLGVTWPVEALTGTSWPNDERAQKILSMSRGALIEPTRLGPFWTTRYRQAQQAYVPVYSSWEETSQLGTAWQMLPAGIESLGDEELTNLAIMQSEAYMSHIPSQYELYDKLTQQFSSR